MKRMLGALDRTGDPKGGLVANAVTSSAHSIPAIVRMGEMRLPAFGKIFGVAIALASAVVAGPVRAAEQPKAVRNTDLVHGVF